MDRITPSQKTTLLSMGYDGPKPIDSLTKHEASVIIQSRMNARYLASRSAKDRSKLALSRAVPVA